MRDCPSTAIQIRKVGEKRFECEIDLSKCIYCAQCVDGCPKKSLETTTEFELAALDRGTLKVIFHVPDPQPTSPAPSEPPGKPEVKVA
jgi:formate hydrogenlyase subunit 6/NADH:ubiquinone oxidoreductase subunit I